MNTLAVRLNHRLYGELLDFFGGLRDIKDKTIRVLHSLSFVEDPTRVLRAIRFEQRFDFRLSKHTLNLIKNAVKMKIFHRLTGERIYAELMLMFSESDPSRLLKRMREFDLLKSMHPGLKGSAETERLFREIGETWTWFRLLYLEEITAEKWFVYFLGLLDRIKDSVVDEILDRLSVPARVWERVRQARLGYRDVLYIFYRQPDLRPSSIYELLAPLEIEAILLMMAKAKQETAKKYVSLFLTHLRDVKVSLTGDDLKQLGLPPGPQYRALLAELRDAKLDGVVKNREEEIAFIRKKIRSS
jgi:tRNA nucleotidyltransferase (CCA-adding enzyme)